MPYYQKLLFDIAQDVMSLFQIVDAEKDLNAVFDDLQIQQQPTSKRKVPPPVPPKRTHSSAESVKTKRESLTRRSTDLTDSPALPTTNAAQTQEEKEQEDIDIKTRIQKIKKQSQEVETLEESLDDFYSLLDSYWFNTMLAKFDSKQLFKAVGMNT